MPSTKGAFISDMQMRILICLKSHRLTIAELVDLLNTRIDVARPTQVTEASISKELTLLAKFPLPDGTIVEFAKEDGEGRWGAVDI